MIATLPTIILWYLADVFDAYLGLLGLLSLTENDRVANGAKLQVRNYPKIKKCSMQLLYMDFTISNKIVMWETSLCDSALNNLGPMFKLKKKNVSF